MNTIETHYKNACDRYSEINVDVKKALDILKLTPVSLHCWQGDDVGGFETNSSGLSDGGIKATGNFKGKARNIEELKQDLEMVFSLIPGAQRLNLHAIYGDFKGEFVERDSICSEHFNTWIDWAKKQDIGIDFNSTFFSHPKASSGFTLASKDKGIRNFWIEHGKRCREISNYIGNELNNRCIHNIWIPDGSKDITVSRLEHRELLRDSLDKILSVSYPPENTRDSVESKLFGIGSESYVVGSHEFYMGYAIKNNIMLCIDIGHYHPTESCADKVSALFLYNDELLFHITRGIRWDSDHVVILNDPVVELMQEIVWADKLSKSNIGLDFFDASINRIGAYVIGTRATQKAILLALLTPLKKLKTLEENGQNFEKLALLEEMKNMPFNAVWDYYCYKNNVPIGVDYIAEIQKYEKEVLNKRN